MRPFNFQNIYASVVRYYVLHQWLLRIWYIWYYSIIILKVSTHFKTCQTWKEIEYCICVVVALLMFQLILSDSIYRNIYIMSSIFNSSMTHEKLITMTIYQSICTYMYRNRYCWYLVRRLLRRELEKMLQMTKSKYVEEAWTVFH